MYFSHAVNYSHEYITFWYVWNLRTADYEILMGTSFSQMSNIKSEMRSFKSNENIHKKEGGSYYVVSANKASSVTL